MNDYEMEGEDAVTYGAVICLCAVVGTGVAFAFPLWTILVGVVAVGLAAGFAILSP